MDPARAGQPRDTQDVRQLRPRPRSQTGRRSRLGAPLNAQPSSPAGGSPAPGRDPGLRPAAPGAVKAGDRAADRGPITQSPTGVESARSLGWRQPSNIQIENHRNAARADGAVPQIEQIQPMTGRQTQAGQGHRVPVTDPSLDTAAELDRLAHRLYERIRGRLAAELLADRERAHLLTDL